ncbi:hypothetical protein EK21DRAFT_83424 [Setomelanomma holmii]|uniref:Uncharacterized protein n=1 Tax=Setomelanomma holmii TaxID=210430 RepID=A0A9P4HLI5_9PLEO|nr:hypothetical protein EK21DRAFT_83424 [Setomelanomma holmii]
MAPKRAAKDDGDKPTKKAKPDTKKRSGDNNNDQFFEILNGDTRDALRVGVAAPSRLKLGLRHKTTGETLRFEYTKAENEINWSSREDINLINKWRRQIFTRKGFPAKVSKYPWTPFEVAYLELAWEKMKLVASADDDAMLPHQSKIFEAFNEFFEGRSDLKDRKGGAALEREFRDYGSLDTRLRRVNSGLKALHDNLKDRIKSGDKSENAWVPDITDEEIEAYIESKSVTYDDESWGWWKDAAKKKKECADAGSKQKNQSGTTINPDGTSANNPSKDIVDAAENTIVPETMVDSPNQDAQRGTRQQPSMPSSPKPSIQVQSNRSPREPQVESEWIVHKEAPVDLTPPEEIARLKSLGFITPEIPENDDEAIERHITEQNKKVTDVSWNRQAFEDLDDRIKRRGALPKDVKAREDWSRDPQAKYEGGLGEEENWHEESMRVRVTGAAAVNGLLNAAVLPPVGYSGHIRDLVKNRRLPDDELRLADTNAEALETLHKIHDENFIVAEQIQKEQRVVDANEPEESGDGSGGNAE